MKFFQLAALFGLASANLQEDVQRDQIYLRDEMKSLLDLVQKVQTQDVDQVLDSVELRKDKLAILMEEKPERNEFI